MLRNNKSGFYRHHQYQRHRSLKVFFAIATLSCFSLIAFLLISFKNSTASVTDDYVRARPEIDMVEILVPREDIRAGVLLKAALFRTEERPRLGLEPDTIRSMEEIRNYFASHFIPADIPVSRRYVSSSRPANQLLSRIPVGYRAVTIRVNAQSAVEGWAQPGSRVDVVWTTRVGGSESLSTIVQDAEVLSAERTTETSTTFNRNNSEVARVPSSVTLLVRSKHAQYIELAKSKGILSLILRGHDDHLSSDLGGPITMSDILPHMKKSDKTKKIEGTVKIGELSYSVINGGLVQAPEDH